MGMLNIPKIILSELRAEAPRRRAPEPSLVMDDQAQVDAYLEAGSERGSLAPLYLYNTMQASTMIQPGDRVLDLACGPANQLTQLAAVNPQASFLGVDLSDAMLERAREQTRLRHLANVGFESADIAELNGIADASVDLVISTLSLHHLPDRGVLERCFAQVRRVLRPTGRVYLADLGGLRSEAAIECFVRQYAAVQPEVFNQDYRNSLRAAFNVGDYRAVLPALGPGVAVYATAVVPFMLVLKSTFGKPLDAERARRIASLRRAMPLHQRRDLTMLSLFFRLGGLVVQANSR